MTDLKKIFHSFGINHLLNASTSGLLLFKKQADSNSYQCTVENESARKMTGLKKINGVNWESLVGNRAGTLAGKTDTVSEMIPNLDREIYFAETNTWCRLSNTPVNENHFLCTLTDITHYKEIENKEDIVLDILRDAEKTVQFGTYIWYNTSQQIEWSQGLYILLGYSAEQAIQCPASIERYIEHIHPDDRERVVANMPESLKTGKPNELEYRVVTLLGQEKYVQSRSIYYPGDAANPAKLTGCIVDVTSIKQVRNQLMEKVEELNRSNGDLEQFAYVASHDLQEPLRKIVSFGERLEKKGRESLDEEMGMYLDRILNATRRMQSMISNLLDFSRLTRTRQGFESTDLNAIARGVLSDLELVIRQKEADIRIDDMPTIQAIPSQMAQLFQNLLSNSLKFTNDAVAPVITVTSDQLSLSEQLNYGLPSDRAYIRLTFNDNGIGFDDVDASRIFTIFQRLRGRSEYEGAGIGLSVCKKVVENHTGIILASARPGVGATFTIILPLAQLS